MRTIDADALIETLRENPPVANIDRVIRDIEDAPTVAMGTDHITINWTPDLDKLARDVAYRALNEFKFLGKSIQEWVEIVLEQPHWVPVEHRLPEQDGVYIVYDGESVYSAEYERGRPVSEWTDDYEGYCDFDVTHWMPMPKPPEGVSGDA